jgi:DNA-binding NtrC family response regulator
MARILIIDDEEQIRNLIALVLARQGHEATQATNGEDGLRLLKDQRFDVVITDIWMPEKDGLEVIREMRRLYPDTKIIAISGGSRNPAFFDTLPLAKKLGVHWTLTKPFPLQDLVDALESVSIA